MSHDEWLDPDGNSGPAPKRRFLPATGKKVWAVVGGAGVLTGLILGAIELSDRLSTREAGTGTLAVEVVPRRTGITGAFAVPITAPFDELPRELARHPSDRYDICSPAQLDWLARYGRAFVNHFYVNLHNTADSGTRIIVDRFSTKGSLETPAVPLVAVYCVEPVGGPISMQSAGLPADTLSTASFLPGIQTDSLAGSPVMYELEPGESADLFLMVSSVQSLEGHLTARVRSGTEEEEVRLSVDGAGPLYLPAFGVTRNFAVHLGGGIGNGAARYSCVELNDGGSSVGASDCTDEELMKRLAGFQAQSGVP